MGKPDDGPYEDWNIEIITKILICSGVKTDPWLFIWSVYGDKLLPNRISGGECF